MVKLFVIVFLNKALNKVGSWGIEAENDDQALEKFRQCHRDFCQVLSINGRNV